MNKTWDNAQYSTIVASDNEDGWTALELRMQAGTDVPKLIARVVFWDAAGQFSFEMSAKKIPLRIVEELIAEARATIKVR
jgi:hypothetical protein